MSRRLDETRRRLQELEGGSVTSLTPTARDPSRWSLRIGGRYALTLPVEVIDALAVTLGSTCDAALVDALLSEATLDDARRYARRQLAMRAMSHGMLADRLRRRGLSATAAASIATEMERVGAIDEPAFAWSLARSIMERRPAGRTFLLAQMRRRHIRRDVAEQVVREALAGQDELAAASDAAERRLRSISGRLPVETISRRLYAFLARRGFDADVCRQVTEKILREQNGPAARRSGTL